MRRVIPLCCAVIDAVFQQHIQYGRGFGGRGAPERGRAKDRACAQMSGAAKGGEWDHRFISSGYFGGCGFPMSEYTSRAECVRYSPRCLKVDNCDCLTWSAKVVDAPVDFGSRIFPRHLEVLT